MKGLLLLMLCGALGLAACDQNRSGTTSTTGANVATTATSSPPPGVAVERTPDGGSRDAASLGGNTGWPTGAAGHGTGGVGQPAEQ